MKRNLLIIIILFVTCGNVSYGQYNKPVQGAFGLTFGSSKINVKEVMRKHNAEIYDEKQTHLLYKDVVLGSQKSDLLWCMFVNNKLYEIRALFSPEVDEYAQALFNELKEIIDNKYEKGVYFRRFKGIYKDGDGFEMQAVKSGNGYIKSYWVDPNFKSTISLEIIPLNKSLTVTLIYQDVTLTEEAVKLQGSMDADIF